MPEQRDRTNSFSLNRNLYPERERSNTFTQIKSHNYLERVKIRRMQKMVIIWFLEIGVASFAPFGFCLFDNERLS